LTSCQRGGVEALTSCQQHSSRWRFSFNSVLQVQVRRAALMWSWSSIRQHRENLKAYKSAYKAKLLSPSRPGPDTERHIQVALNAPPTQHQYTHILCLYIQYLCVYMCIYTCVYIRVCTPS